MTEFFGQFHSAVVHFPIALLLTAMAAEAAAWITGKAWLHAVGAFNLHLGGLSAVVAAALGYALSATADVETALQGALLWHRWIGTVAALWAVLALVAWHCHRLLVMPGGLAWYRFSLLTGSALVAVSGFLGGVLIHGWDHYQWPH